MYISKYTAPSLLLQTEEGEGVKKYSWNEETLQDEDKSVTLDTLTRCITNERSVTKMAVISGPTISWAANDTAAPRPEWEEVGGAVTWRPLAEALGGWAGDSYPSTPTPRGSAVAVVVRSVCHVVI